VRKRPTLQHSKKTREEGAVTLKAGMDSRNEKKKSISGKKVGKIGRKGGIKRGGLKKTIAEKL